MSAPAAGVSPAPLAAPLVVAFVVGVTPGKWARVWEQRMPRHPLELRALPPSDALAALESAQAQLALLRLPLEPGHEATEFSVIPLYSEQPVVVAPQDHPVEALDALVLADLQGETVLEGDWRQCVELVAAGAGVALMPQSVARALSRRDVIARPVTDAPATRVALVWPAANTTPEVEEFIGIVRGRTPNSSRGRQPAAQKPAARQPSTQKGSSRSGRGH